MVPHQGRRPPVRGANTKRVERRRRSVGTRAGNFSSRAYPTVPFFSPHTHPCTLPARSDLKPENFLLGSHEPKAVLKVTDFGLSCR